MALCNLFIIISGNGMSTILRQNIIVDPKDQHSAKYKIVAILFRFQCVNIAMYACVCRAISMMSIISSWQV